MISNHEKQDKMDNMSNAYQTLSISPTPQAPPETAQRPAVDSTHRRIDADHVSIDGELYKRMRTVGGIYTPSKRKLYMRKWRAEKRRFARAAMLSGVK